MTRRDGAGYALRIAALTVAVIALLAALAVPHHHHSGRACVAEVENLACDHSDSHCPCHHDGDGSTCIEKEAFVVAKIQQANVHPSITLLALPAQPTCIPDSPLTGEQTHSADVFIAPYYVIGACQSLRAPPAMA